MKCLSLRQPFAMLLASGKKTIELRKWNTNYRGEFLIHASKRIDRIACERLGIGAGSLATGAVVGKAFVYGVKVYKSWEDFEADREKHMATWEEFSDSKYGFLIKGAVKFGSPIPANGMLNFFELEI